jgi:2-polyprenyl-3-methyl-5-hydroxy-6-metoxy-1,4-benzoquinol methylase
MSQIYYVNPRKEMVKYLPPKAQKVLDVGCASGAFGAKVKETNPKVVFHGVEALPEYAKKAEERYEKIYVGDYLDLNITEKYDAIYFNDVLEHMYDPWEALKKSKSLLADGGVIVASIPNIRFYKTLFGLVFKKDWEYEESGILDRTHIRFFTEKSILNMFNQLGFEILEFEGVNYAGGWKFGLLNLLTLGLMKDTGYLEFAIVAR